MLNADICNSMSEFSEVESYRLLYYEQIQDKVKVISIQTYHFYELLISQSDGLNGRKCIHINEERNVSMWLSDGSKKILRILAWQKMTVTYFCLEMAASRIASACVIAYFEQEKFLSEYKAAVVITRNFATA